MKKYTKTILILIFFAVVGLLISSKYNFWKAPQISSVVKSVGDGKGSGEIVLRNVDGLLVVNLSLDDHHNTSEEGLFLQSGSCKKLMEVKYYLASVYDGKSSSTLDIKFNKFVKELPLSVVVYGSKDTTGKILYCGDILAN